MNALINFRRVDVHGPRDAYYAEGATYHVVSRGPTWDLYRWDQGAWVYEKSVRASSSQEAIMRHCWPI